MTSTPSSFSDAFVIVTRGRTGSSFLVDMLNKHPEITCHMELLTTGDFGQREPAPLSAFCEGRPTQDAARDYFSYLRDFTRDKKNRFGFKILYHQFDEWSDYDFMNFISQNYVKVIFLKRRDLFRLAISTIVARTENLYNATDSQLKTNKQLQERYKTHQENIGKGVVLAPEEVLQAARNARHSNRMIPDELKNKGTNFIEVSYEDLTESQLQAMKKITDFLEVSEYEEPPTTDYVKVLPKDPNSFILNMGEIRDHFTKTGNDLLVGPRQERRGIRALWERFHGRRRRSSA